MTTAKMSYPYAKIILSKEKENKMSPMKKLDLALELLKGNSEDSVRGHALAYAGLSGYLMAYATDEQADKILELVTAQVAKSKVAK